MKNKKIIIFLKCVSGITAFLLIFSVVNILRAPKYPGESTSMVDGLSAMPKDSVDVLVLGASQMFCGVNAQKLTEEYSINTFNYGSSGQPFPISVFYLKEALKRQKPKLLLVEVSSIFVRNIDIDEKMLSWSYSPQRFSLNKLLSIWQVTGNDYKSVFKYCFPALEYTKSWQKFKWVKDISYFWEDKTCVTRGFLARDTVTPVDITYLSEDSGEKKTIPQESIDSICEIDAIAQKNGIKVLYFKTPVSDWSRTTSQVVKSFMEQHSFDYFDMNDYLNEIGIDGKTDFYNPNHLNSNGAEKATDYLAHFLISKKLV